MRRTPPPPIHFLTTAATDNSAASATSSIMSSYPRQRGRGGRFSGRSFSSGRGQFVTGDSHFRSVRDDNLGYRRGEKGNFVNQTQPYYPNQTFYPRPQPPLPPPPYQQNSQFRHPYPPHRPPPAIGQQFHPRQKAPDHREWEAAKTPPPPPHCERFKVLSYNILADYLAWDHRRTLYFHIPQHMLDWQWRKRSILFELGWWSADIMCFQEVDRFHDLAEELKLKGYTGIWKMRTGNPVDGCAIFWQISRFKLLYEESVEFNKLGLRDNVAQICVLEFINQNGSVPSSLTGYSKIVVCNIHVLYNPKRGEIKLGQVRVLLNRANAVSKLWNNAPVVICGDFNCTPKSPLYNFISEQKLDLSGIERDKLSGQASAKIRSPPRLERFSGGSAQAVSIEGDKEVNVEQNNSLSDMQNPGTKCNSSENQYARTVLDVSKLSLTNVQHGKENVAYAGKDTQEPAIEHLKEEQDPSYGEARLPVDSINAEIHDITVTTSSDTVAALNQESLSKESNLHVPEGSKHMEINFPPTSLQEDNQSSKVKIGLESTDLLNLEISITKPSSETSVSDVNDQRNSPSTSDLIGKSHQSTNIDFPLDEKLEKSFLDEVDKAIIGSENTGEDDNAFISSLHNAEEGVTLDPGPSIKSDIGNTFQFDESDSASNKLLLAEESNEVEDGLSPSPSSKSIDAENTPYNPSLWTPMEIETATGNVDCTFLEHQLPLRSTYTEAMDCSGTRDPHGEPLVTSYNRCFLGTVDYIWRSEGLQTTRVLAPIPKHAMDWTPGFPTKKWGSDHIALVSELALLKDGIDINKDVQ
ncbi:hypothetical protein TanjilG_19357 [Lupinus angustifolius]|uniref:Endonuclease/exonuclease/phosphatase domain-containing protein n=1 Tax=Lupinus angustifolius TaxID=3871 RepID=A0A1J7HMZ4_LUPAN|nr:PREDICTED: carbon catabolite repressor protein 4 homolog 6 [Lupinus angustifolius]XP_019457884.1 PREDICTED: carbon catabolite repressor protein 4 homolog 6 [Lupinus angustifolius]XP_019457885.1 PREDICTED: carbon catabolite repressor protein 4 homolog 6 [Lupinus angustifolius]OIW03077.1 hypothetical protein TanjilG_19357 [Lupinus angustifolius]